MRPIEQPPWPDDIELFRFRGGRRELRAVHRQSGPVVLDPAGNEGRLSAAEEAARATAAWSVDEISKGAQKPILEAFVRLWSGAGGLPPNPLAVMVDTT